MLIIALLAQRICSQPEKSSIYQYVKCLEFKYGSFTKYTFSTIATYIYQQSGNAEVWKIWNLNTVPSLNIRFGIQRIQLYSGKFANILPYCTLAHDPHPAVISNFARTYTSGYLIRIATVTLNPSVPRLRPSPLHTSQHSRAFTPAHSRYNHWMHTAEHKNNQTTCQNIKQLRLARLATLNRHLLNGSRQSLSSRLRTTHFNVS